MSVLRTHTGRSWNGGQPWGFVDQGLTAGTANGLCWHEQGPRIDTEGTWGYQLWPGVGNAGLELRVGTERVGAGLMRG